LNVLINNEIVEEAVFGAAFAAWEVRPRSPMMTVSGIAAKGLPPDFITRRIAAESACPQLTAVWKTDTELRFAVIPVILNNFNEIRLQRYKKSFDRQ
jgi:hypothetical protein